jgi:porin
VAEEIEMYVAARALVIATLFLTASLVPGPVSYGQEPTPSPTSTPGASIADKVKKEAETLTPAAREPAADKSKIEGQTDPRATAASPTPTPEPDFWTQEEMTGDWGGTRTRWKEKGVDMEFKLTQFYQGVARGGIQTGSVYNGVLKGEFKFDLEKLGEMKFWSAELQMEMRYGGPMLGGTGTISPVNTAALIPGANGTVFSITAANVTKLFPKDLKKGNLFALSVGRYNLVDLIQEDFFGGSGTEKFFNIAQIGPLTVLRQVPLITNGASFAYIRHGEPFVTFTLLDPNDHSTNPGLADLFTDGVTFYPGINFPTKYWGKTGKHSFGFAITTKKYTPFDAIRQVIIPGPPINPVQPKRGSRSISYVFRQYIVERAPHDGWGLFGQVAFADKDTSPITIFFELGLGGNGLFKGRRREEFGIAYAYTDLSSVLKNNINLLTLGGRPLRAEHQVEGFYNFHIIPWLRLTGDLQIIRPTRTIAKTAIIPPCACRWFFRGRRVRRKEK